MECNRRLIKNEPTRKRVRDQVQYLFRLPRRWMQLVQNKLHGSTGLGIVSGGFSLDTQSSVHKENSE
ncbi:uncharacterized protein Gasu_36400 [Galdieria sulphuraria]|uniref:Uncharacterized protein n=1 Tax=Galdieria sulphuraria TaxID=130081 RepID=M2VZX3_GALSU|nr:uncharacterized protein Gasu_36400 [Galdieria sulphuraria]EME28901.1 hypothetical protein Gasu_36400 [Galdieria sulphuraria]|eukprot:XP_005705421.1 hypothetical protein Gasu_36400 [Galdieria sulphuraria]